jgi:hypothetical protein
MVVPSPSDSPPVELGDKENPGPLRHSYHSALCTWPLRPRLLEASIMCWHMRRCGTKRP